MLDLECGEGTIYPFRPGNTLGSGTGVTGECFVGDWNILPSLPLQQFKTWMAG